MKAPIHQLDAFTDQLFRGNPAAVVRLDAFLPDAVLQACAEENNLAETAYVVPTHEPTRFGLRWFTPTVEIALCGHATLATAHVIFASGAPGNLLRFDTKSGELRVERRPDGRLELDFPKRTLAPIADPGLAPILGRMPTSVFDSGTNYFAVFESEGEVAELRPDFRALRAIPRNGIVVTAPGDRDDFVSRYFASPVGVDEDPVTGSAHTELTPYWAERLGRTSLVARQISKRGGHLLCRLDGDRVRMAGFVTPYLEGTIELPDTV